MESMKGIGGERSGFGVAKDLDGLLGCVHNHPTILAFFEVLLNLLSKGGIKLFVEIVGEFDDDRFALHELSPCRKYRFSFWRSFKRARNSRDFTAGTDSPNTSAVSSVDNSSMSRN